MTTEEHSTPLVVAFTKKDLEEAEDRRLPIYASRASRAVRRYPTPAEGRSYDYRTEFQRDRDRIIHSRSFRRLKHKTQVFIPFEGDHTGRGSRTRWRRPRSPGRSRGLSV